MYALSIENEGLEKGIDILSEVTLRPVISDEQVHVLAYLSTLENISFLSFISCPCLIPLVLV